MNDFEDNDMGYDELVDSFGELGKVDITAGVHSDDAAQVTNDDGEPAGINLAALLSIHEWGATIDHPGGTPFIIVDDEFIPVSKDHPNPMGYTTPHTIEIPERSVLRATIAENEQKYAELQKAAIIQVLEGEPPERAFDKVALALEGDIKRRFGDKSKLEENAPSTIRQKGSSGPLIDDAQLRQAIAARVDEGEGL